MSSESWIFLLNNELKIYYSIIVEAVEDLLFLDYYKTFFHQINFIIEKNCKKIDERLFTGQEVDPNYIEDLFLSILEGWKDIDKGKAEQMLANYLKAKKLLQLHDVDI